MPIEALNVFLLICLRSPRHWLLILLPRCFNIHQKARLVLLALYERGSESFPFTANLILIELSFEYGTLLEVEVVRKGVVKRALNPLLVFVEFLLELGWCTREIG